MIAGRNLIDTNVLVYAYDVSEPIKRKRAFEVIDGLAERGTGVLSAQILSEFFTVVTRKLPKPLRVEDAVQRVENYLRAWRVLPITPPLVLEALRGVQTYRMTYWDSLVWATAKLNQVPTILGEDFSDGTVLEGVRFSNPFL